MDTTGCGRGAVDEQGARQVGREHVADRLRRLALEILQQRDCHAEDLIESAGDEPQDARRQARDDPPFNAVEIGLLAGWLMFLRFLLLPPPRFFTGNKVAST